MDSGAVLSHRMPDGPIGYASRTLTHSERNYSQLEKEGLSCIFGIKRFHDYVFGRPFQLITPLLGLLRENKAVSPQSSARILFVELRVFTVVPKYYCTCQCGCS